MNHREKYDLLLTVQDRLAKAGTEKWLIRRLAASLLRHFPGDPLGTFDIFIRNGWSSSDIFHWLTHALSFRRQDPNWADSFIHIFFIEELMQKAGLSRGTAHSLSITQVWVFTIPPERLELSIRTLVYLGYDEDVIKSIANRMPHIFHLLAENIIQECEKATDARRGLLWNTKHPSPFSRSGIEPKYQTIPEQAKSSELPIEKNGDGTKALMTQHGVGIPKEITADARNPVKAAKKALPPLRVFNPLVKTIASHPFSAETREEAVEELVGEKKEKYTYRDPSPGDEAQKNHASLDLKQLRSIVESTSRGSEKAWTKFQSANQWLNYLDSTEYQAFMLFSHWVPIHNQITPEHFRDESKNGIKARFWQKMLLDPKFNAVLKLDAKTLELRMYILRRIGREFMNEPEWLLLEWEVLDSIELRYRINEIDARGKKAHRKPYINMILEPTRAGFLARLTKYLDGHRKKYFYQSPMMDAFDEVDEIDWLPSKPMTGDELKKKLLRARKKK